MNCPCGSEKEYLQCCALYIDQKELPPTAEALMRSRYTAYCQANINYIADTMRGPALKGFSQKEALNWAKQVNWQHLEIILAEETTVEFIAYFELNGKVEQIHEKSLFKNKSGRWLYFGSTPR